MTTSHPSAGLYVPSTPGATTVEESRPLRVMGEPVSAVVGPDGAYSVLIGGRVVAYGRLDGTEGDLMAFFSAEAIIAGGPDDEAATLLADDEPWLYRPVGQPRPVNKHVDPATVVQALGGTYEVQDAQTRERLGVISSGSLACRIRRVQHTGGQVVVGLNGAGREFIELSGPGREPKVYYKKG